MNQENPWAKRKDISLLNTWIFLLETTESVPVLTVSLNSTPEKKKRIL
jgi:hypothetical protein